MFKMKIISIVVPIFNEEKTIVRCLNSLQNQSFPKENYEIIVVDSSKDTTPKIIRKNFPNIRLIHLSEQTYPGGARNIGIKNAKGKIIAFTDGDCIADKDWLKNIYEYHKYYDIVGGCVENANSDMLSYLVYLTEFNYVLPKRKEKFVKHIPTCNISYKKNLFDDVFFRKDLLAGEDLFLNKILLKKGFRIFFTPKIKIAHINKRSFKQFFLYQFKFGKYAFYVHKSFNDPKMKFPFVLLFPIAKFFLVGYRVIKAGYFPLFILLLPFYSIILFSFSMGLFWGYLNGI